MPKNKSKDKCVTKWCRNKAAINNTGRRLKLCWKCRAHLLKQRHPVTYALNAMRSRAKQRGIPFTLTLDEFKEFCKRTNYIERKGTSAGGMTVDRIDRNEGYHAWNIRCLEFMENSMQGADNTPRRTAIPDIADDNEPF